MGSGNWIIDNLNASLELWNAKLAEIWLLLTQSPEAFKGGAVWEVIVNINGAIKAIAYGLLVLFFVMGVIKTSGSFTEIKRPEHVFKLFIRFVLAKAAVSYGMDLMLAMISIAQGAISTIMTSSGLQLATGATTLPQEVITSITNVGFWDSIPLWIVTLIGCLLIWVLSLIMILTVYGRFFKIYMATAIAPVPLASFAGEPSSNIGKSFARQYAALCLQGCVIVLACIIFSAFMTEPPALGNIDGLSAVNVVWKYVGELIFNMLVLVGAVKTSDRLIKDLMGLN